MPNPWPSLPFDTWKDTCATLHLWSQIVGKVRLALEPAVNHWWHVPLYVSARGLTTFAMPWQSEARHVELELDFVDHALVGRSSDGASATFPLRGQSVREFYHETRDLLDRLHAPARIWPVPVELADAVPFERDVRDRAYDRESARTFWQILMHADRVLRQFRGRFIGKASPVHFFWGSFDLAVTRFSGRGAPPHPGGVPNIADWVVREAYSHEVSSCGFWPGTAGTSDAAFYAYAYPEPEGFATYTIDVEGARYDPNLREFLLPYDTVRRAPDPAAHLMAFLQRTYEAAAVPGRWDRAALEN